MKNQRDKNGRLHGYWESYFPNGKLWYKGYYNNDKLHGLWEWYYHNGGLGHKGAYNRDKKVGLWSSLTK